MIKLSAEISSNRFSKTSTCSINDPEPKLDQINKTCQDKHLLSKTRGLLESEIFMLRSSYGVFEHDSNTNKLKS